MDNQDFYSKLNEFISSDCFINPLAMYKYESIEVFNLSFDIILNYDIDLANYFLDNFEDAITYLNMVTKKEHDVSVRLTNMPVSEHKFIWQLRERNLDKLVIVDGFLRKVTNIILNTESVKYECRSCGSVKTVKVINQDIKPTVKCACSSLMKRMEDITEDTQKMVIEEDLQALENSSKPHKILAVLRKELCTKEIYKKVQPSKKVRVTGLLKKKELKKNSAESEFYIEVHNVEFIDGTYETSKFTDEELIKIREVSKSPTLIDDMAQSIVPNVYGHNLVKKAVTLQLFGAVNLYKKNILEERGTINILLVGSPGTSKTQILKRATLFLPNARFTAGRVSSGVGLIAAVTKDEELGGWSLEAGAVPMANKSLIAIDEIDKMDKGDISMMNNAMNDLKVTVDKANVHSTLETDVCVLCAANPTNRVFDDREPIWKQIGLPKDFIDRFDLVFPVNNPKTEDEQKKIAKVIFGKYRNDPAVEPIYDREFVTKYIAYARQNIKPIIQEETQNIIISSYLKLVKPNTDEEDKGYFSSRFITNIIRLAIASAKARLSNEVELSDAKLALDIITDSLKKQGLINEYGTIETLRIEDITPKKQRDKLYLIMDIIKELCEQSKDSAEFELIRFKAKSFGIEDQELDEVMRKLKDKGDIFEPRRDRFKIL